MKTHPRRKSGFTLMEMMMVIGIMAILMGAGIYYLRGTVQASAVTRAQADINHLATLISTYTFRSHNLLPPKELKDLIRKPQNVRDWEAEHRRDSKWSQLLRDETDLVDPWGNQYQYAAGDDSKFNANFFRRTMDDKGAGAGDYMKAFDIWSTGPAGDDTEGVHYGINNWGDYATSSSALVVSP